MATTVMKMVIQFRRDVAANWELHKDVVPAAGEPCYVTDKNILKIGDGVTSFGDLQPINGASVTISADEKSVVLENDVFKLMGFDAAQVGAQPRKAENGTIEWVVPADVSTLTSDVAELKSDVTNLKTAVTNLQEIVTPSGEGDIPLLSRIATLEDKMDGAGEGSVDAKIDAKINAFANEISDDGKVNTLKELVDYVANNGSDLTVLVTDVANLQKLVGDDPVSDQITSAINSSTLIKGVKVNGTLLDAVDGVVNIAIAEQTLGVKGSDEIDVAEDGTLSIKSIGFDKIAQKEGDTIVMDGGSAV